MKEIFLYVHIPYCHHKCPYCDFNTAVEANIPEEAYTQALLAEIDFYSGKNEWRDRALKTIYFGGGTPSIFNPKIYRRLIYSAFSRFKPDQEIEITLEANPNDLNFDDLRELREIGINRLSIGAQSFNAQTLRELGRTHEHEQIVLGVEAARKAGFQNISLDLIFGAPNQTIDHFKSDLETLVSLQPEHASLYSLTIEKGTEFFSRKGKGKLTLPKDDTVADMMDEAVGFLPTHGLNRYEVSNFSKPGFESRHNSAYWDLSDYLGVGSGAHSMFTDKDGTRVRWANVADPKNYMNQVSAAQSAQAWSERVQGAELGFEYLMLGLRHTKGVSINGFEAITRRSLFDTYPGIVEVLEGSKFLTVNGDTLTLTDRGLAVADSVVENFLPEKT